MKSPEQFIPPIKIFEYYSLLQERVEKVAKNPEKPPSERAIYYIASKRFGEIAENALKEHLRTIEA